MVMIMKTLPHKDEIIVSPHPASVVASLHQDLTKSRAIRVCFSLLGEEVWLMTPVCIIPTYTFKNNYFFSISKLYHVV